MLELLMKLFGLVADAIKPSDPKRIVEIVDAHKQANSVDKEIDKQLDAKSKSE